jgi:hypothetical protein
MAIELLSCAEYCWPGWPGYGALGGQIMDGADHKHGGTGIIVYSGTINKIHVPIRAVSQNPINGIKLSFQGHLRVGNNLQPDGISTHYRVIPTGDIEANTVVVSELVTDDGTDNGAKKTVVVNDFFTIILEFENFVAGDSYTPVYIGAMGTGIAPTVTGGLCHWDIGGGWTYSLNVSPSFLIEYADGMIIGMPAQQHNIGTVTHYGNVTGTAASDPNEVGLKFVAPHSGEIGGVCIWGLYADDWLWTLYDSGDNVLGTYTSLKNDRWANYHCAKIWFDTPILVIKGSTYRLTQKPSGATFRLYYSDYSVAAAAQMLGGVNFVWTQRKDSGIWTDINTRKPNMGVLYTKFEPGGVVPQSLHSIGEGITI